MILAILLIYLTDFYIGRNIIFGIIAGLALNLFVFIPCIGSLLILIVAPIPLILNNIIEPHKRKRKYEKWLKEEKKKSKMTVGERAIYEELKELNDSKWIIVG